MQLDLIKVAEDLVDRDICEIDPTQVVKNFKKYKALEKFFMKFANSMVICDPMDRKIMGEYEENQAILVEELIKRVDNLVPLQGSSLSVPLEEDHYTSIKQMFSDQFEQIT